MALFDLVFEGGGAKGAAFVGALEVLAAAGHKHRRLIGTSAGAITATLLGAGYSAAELLQATSETLPGTTDPVFTTFMDAPKPTDFDAAQISNSQIMELLEKAHVPGFASAEMLKLGMQLDLFREMFSFNECGGFYSGNAFLAWFRNKLKPRDLIPTSPGLSLLPRQGPTFPWSPLT